MIELSQDQIRALIETASPIAEGLLPANSTDIEKAVVTAEVARFLAYEPEIIATIWDPYRVSEELLPYLAWALSVDVWDTNWSIERKRAVVAAAPEVHRLKGTRGAVERALAALDTEVEITEWWETEPIGVRGTFQVNILSRNEDGVGLFDLSTQADKAVRASKPKSRTALIQSTIAIGGPMRVGLVPGLQAIWHVFPSQFDGLDVPSQMNAAVAPHSQLNWLVSAEQ